MAGTVLTVASGKGGVGKTTTAVNLAVALWREGNAVAVVDADLGMANLASVLGLEPETTLHDVLAGRASLDEAVVEARDGDLVVLPGERDLSGFASADPGKLGEVLAELAEGRDYVVVDTGAGLSYEDVLPLGLADAALLVTTPEPAAVGDTRKTLELSGLLDGSVLGVVVTRAREDTDAAAVAAEIGVDLLGVVPEDPAVTESTMGGGPLESLAPDAPATAAYREVAAAVEDAAPRPSPSSQAGEPSAVGGEEPAGADAETGTPGPDEPGPADETDADGGSATGSPPGEGVAAAEPAADEPGAGAPAEAEPDRDEAPADGASSTSDREPDEAEPVADDDRVADGAGTEVADGAEADTDDPGGAADDGDGEADAADDGKEAGMEHSGDGDAPDEEEPDADGDGEAPDSHDGESDEQDLDEDGDDGDADVDDGRGDAADESEEQDDAGGRGGLLGWLGRRF